MRLMFVLLFFTLIFLIASLVLNIMSFTILSGDIIRVYSVDRMLSIPRLERVGPGNYTLTEYKRVLDYRVRDETKGPGIIFNRIILVHKLENASIRLLGSYYLVEYGGYGNKTPLSIIVYGNGSLLSFDELYVDHFTRQGEDGKLQHVFVCKFGLNLTSLVPVELNVRVMLERMVYVKELTMILEYKYNRTYSYPYPTLILRGYEPVFLHYIMGVNYEEMRSLLNYIVLSQILTAIAIVVSAIGFILILRRR